MTKPVPPEMVALVRRLYADGVAVAAIEAQAGVNTDILYRCVDGQYRR